MSAHPQPSPPGAIHGPHGPLAQVNGHMPMQAQPQKVLPISQKIAQLNEGVWLQIGMFLFSSFLSSSETYLSTYLHIYMSHVRSVPLIVSRFAE